MFLFLCLLLPISINFFLYLAISVSLHLYLFYIYLSIYLCFVSISVSLTLYIFYIYLSLYLCFYPSVTVYISISDSVSPSVSVYNSIYLNIISAYVCISVRVCFPVSGVPLFDCVLPQDLFSGQSNYFEKRGRCTSLTTVQPPHWVKTSSLPCHSSSTTSELEIF